jgi:hypothetical protein
MTLSCACIASNSARFHRIVFVVLAFFAVVTVRATAQSLTVTGSDGHATMISAAQLASASRVSVSTDDHGVAAKFEGVPLATVLAMAGIQLADSLRGPRMAEVLLVSASDGYKVAFALAEVDPAFAVREIILADKRDGKPLDAREGPFRIIAPGDKRPARWIRQVTDFKIISLK